MSRYAKINSENIVENIIECRDSVISELEGNYIKVNQENYIASIGDEYFPEVGKFREKKWFDSWSWDEDLWKWVAPIAKPSGEGKFLWSESNQEWFEVIPTEE